MLQPPAHALSLPQEEGKKSTQTPSLSMERSGTVVTANDLPRAIKEAKAGRVEFRLDKTGNIHVSIGKASFSADQLYENFATLMTAIRKARPSGAKGEYVKRVTVTTTMGPAIKV